MDLGKKIEECKPCSTEISSDSEKKISYPSFTVRDKVLDGEVGDEFECKAKFKIVGFRDDQYGKETSIEIQSMDIGEGEEEGPEPTEGSAQDHIESGLKDEMSKNDEDE